MQQRPTAWSDIHRYYKYICIYISSRYQTEIIQDVFVVTSDLHAMNNWDENSFQAQLNSHLFNMLWKLRVVLKGTICVHARIHMYMTGPCVNVRGVGIGKGRYRGPGSGGVCCLPLSAPRLSQCGVMSALRLFSRQGSYWKHTLLLRRPISSVTQRAEWRLSGASTTACQCWNRQADAGPEKNWKIISRLF